MCSTSFFPLFTLERDNEALKTNGKGAFTTQSERCCATLQGLLDYLSTAGSSPYIRLLGLFFFLLNTSLPFSYPYFISFFFFLFLNALVHVHEHRHRPL